jgi:hypothetical protein
MMLPSLLQPSKRLWLPCALARISSFANRRASVVMELQANDVLVDANPATGCGEQHLLPSGDAETGSIDKDGIVHSRRTVS